MGCGRNISKSRSGRMPRSSPRPRRWRASAGARISACGRFQLEQSRAGSRAGRRQPRRNRGATLGNDVNLRDFEGRSALLLSKAKDNNASCAIGPFIRLFDDSFTLDDMRSAVVELEIVGPDDFRLRRPEPDERDQPRSRRPSPPGDERASLSRRLRLFLGTLFAPTEDRDEPGRGFTHKIGDEVRISTPLLGTLANRVTTSRDAPPWKFGTRALMRNLSSRGLIECRRTLTHLIGGETPRRRRVGRKHQPVQPRRRGRALSQGRRGRGRRSREGRARRLPGLVRSLARGPLRRARQGRQRW